MVYTCIYYNAYSSSHFQTCSARLLEEKGGKAEGKREEGRG